jgi:hypothetical protein
MLEFMTDQGRPPDNIDIILARFSKGRQEAECILLLELVDKEVFLKQKELLVNTVEGVLHSKIECKEKSSSSSPHISPLMLHSEQAWGAQF